MNTIDREIMRTPRIRIRAEEPEHWAGYLERILGDFPEVQEVRLIIAESIVPKIVKRKGEQPAGQEHYQTRAWKKPAAKNNRRASRKSGGDGSTEFMHFAAIMAIYLNGPSTTHRMRRLRLTLSRIFPERNGKPVRFTIVSAGPRGRTYHGLMGKIMEKGACLYTAA